MVEIKHTTEKLTIQGKINYSSEYTITDIEVPLHEELTNQQQSYD